MGFFILRSFHFFWWVLITFTPFAVLWIGAGFFFYPFAKKRAWRDLPQVIEKLGLKFEQSGCYSELGVFSGMIDGYQITITPDASGKVVISFLSEKKIEFWTRKSREWPTKGMQDFTTENQKFNAIFRTRRAGLDVSEQIFKSSEFTDSFVNFYIRWIWHLESIYIDERRVRCSFAYGQPFFCYLPADVIEEILFDLLELGRQIDRLSAR